jgi:hypothetical protein
VRLDHAALRSLPTELYIFGKWEVARVNIDYHVEIEAACTAP